MTSGRYLGKQKAACSQMEDRPVWLTFAASHSVMETQARIGQEKRRSVILWMCTSSGPRLPKQAGTIRFLSTAHIRAALLEMTSRTARKDSFTRHCLCPPQILRPLTWTLQGCRQSAKECFCKHHFSDGSSSVKNEDILEPSPLPLLWAASRKLGTLAFRMPLGCWSWVL